MLNRIVLLGRMVRDPELRHTPQNTPVCTFTLAVERDVKGPSGERETDFFDVVAWRSTGEFVSKYLAKGRMALVEGRMQIREWTDKDGNKRRNAEVIASGVYFADSNRETIRLTDDKTVTPFSADDFIKIENVGDWLPFWD